MCVLLEIQNVRRAVLNIKKSRLQIPAKRSLLARAFSKYSSRAQRCEMKESEWHLQRKKECFYLVIILYVEHVRISRCDR